MDIEAHIAAVSNKTLAFADYVKDQLPRKISA
jgi:hypothetical protein